MQTLGNSTLGFTPSASLPSSHHLHCFKQNVRITIKPKLAIAISASSSSQEQRFFATCAPGLEQVVAAELSSPFIAASNIKPGSSGVSFTGSFGTAYNANLWLRCAIRVLVELASAPIPAQRGRRDDPIYQFVRDSVDWKTLIVQEDVFHEEDVDVDHVMDVGNDGGGGLLHASGNPSAAFGGSSFSGLSASQRERRQIPQHSLWKFRTFAVQTRTHDCPQVNNSMFASIRAKDAICDAIRYACGGSKPSPPEDGGATADVPLFLSVYRDTVSLYRDMSGISLHRRGYRDAMHKASLNEALAAGCLTIAGWNQEIEGFGDSNSGHVNHSLSLLDPMCGSGTFLIEAALMACNHAPGLWRQRWPFETWHDFNNCLWKECRDTAAAAKRPPPKGLMLMGNDVHEGALSLCIKDAKAAGVHDLLQLSCKACECYIPPSTPSLVVVNPPWGARLGMDSVHEPVNVIPIWQELGQFLKQRCNHADVYVLSGNSSVTRGLRMKCNRKWPITVGGMECKLLHYYVLPPKNSTTQHVSLASVVGLETANQDVLEAAA
ncbi:hypothetical protein GOP47_0017593 [Adiantum capillus-veneris]|uniref:Uncharacterized protein n=1 Tax=Adiantum capillus-veneris TaxID=13818 RepID=A0A9D4UFX9_ADICA|nr:hypothetical protein GOP47_0017593 [Adiantum capillus-veneris]